MKRELLFYKILGCIHIVFFISILMMGIIVLSGTLCSFPAIGAAFLLGKDQLYHRLDVTDSIVKTYFQYFKKALRLMKYVPISMIGLLNITAASTLARTENSLFGVLFLGMAAMVYLLELYTIGYWVFVSEKGTLIDVFISMFYKPLFFISLYMLMVLLLFFGNSTILGLGFLAGAFFLFAVEVVIFIQMLSYKKLIGAIDPEEEYMYLIQK